MSFQRGVRVAFVIQQVRANSKSMWNSGSGDEEKSCSTLQVLAWIDAARRIRTSHEYLATSICQIFVVPMIEAELPSGLPCHLITFIYSSDCWPVNDAKPVPTTKSA